MSPLASSFSLLYSSSSRVSVAYSALEAGKNRLENHSRCQDAREATHTLNDGVHGAALLAEATVDALGHVDIVTGRPAASIHTLLGFDGDGLGRADGFAELASNATLLTGGIATQSVLTTETGRDGSLLEWVENGVSGVRKNSWSEDWIQLMMSFLALASRASSWGYSRRLKILLQRDIHATEDLGQEEVLAGLVEGGLGACVPALGRGQTETGLRGTCWGCCAGHRGREVCGRADGHEGRAAVGD